MYSISTAVVFLLDLIINTVKFVATALACTVMCQKLYARVYTIHGLFRYFNKVNICNKTAEKTYFKAKAWKQAQSKYNFKLHMPFYGLIQQFKNLD